MPVWSVNATPKVFLDRLESFLPIAMLRNLCVHPDIDPFTNAKSVTAPQMTL